MTRNRLRSTDFLFSCKERLCGMQRSAGRRMHRLIASSLQYTACFSVCIYPMSGAGDVLIAGGPGTLTPCSQSLAILHDAMTRGKTFFIRVHAAEALLIHGRSGGIDPLFRQLRRQSPDNEIGALRVLARVNRNRTAAYSLYTGQLKAHVHDTAVRTRLVALESLGKLGCYTTTPQIRNYADTGTGGFKAMARWVLSTKGTPGGEDSLSVLLLSADLADYRYAAYALRFRAGVRAQTVRRLKQCLAALQADDAARVYLASCLFIHDKSSAAGQTKELLLTYASGNTGQRYEVAEALGIAGTATDLPVLQRLQADSEADVRVAAANAVLKILRCRD